MLLGLVSWVEGQDLEPAKWAAPLKLLLGLLLLTVP